MSSQVSAWKRSPREREETAAVFRALRDWEPLTVEEALDFALAGWNLRCNRCGSYGAEWLDGQRPGWGALALCPPHRDELRTELRRHEEALATLRQVNFEQEDAARVQKRAKQRQRSRRATR